MKVTVEMTPFAAPPAIVVEGSGGTSLEDYREDWNTQALGGSQSAGKWLTFHTFKLVCTEGADRGREWVIDQPSARLGAGSEAEVRLKDPAVSRHHAQIQRTANGWKIVDSGSRNGLTVNGTRIESAFLEPGAAIRLGSTQLTFAPVDEEVLVVPSAADSFHGLVGDSPAIRQIFGVLERVAAKNVSVLLTGPTGTGKGAIARALHSSSSRRNQPFLVLDCAGVDPSLLAASLFGHTRGAFTGASDARQGLFEAAAGGTVFIDEIGELPLELQPKLLRVLEDREVTPLGSQQAVKVDVRVVSATHRDLKQLVGQGKFREDLYYRLGVLELPVPSLEARREDIPRLAEHFLRGWDAAERLPLSIEVLHLLKDRPWPGNIRQLRNVLERAHALADEGPFTAASFETGAPGTTGASVSQRSPAEELALAEKEIIARTLKELGGNKTHAAKALDMAVTTLRKKMKDYGLDDEP